MADQKQKAKKFVATIQQYKHVFSTKEGEKVLYDIMKNCHVLGPTYIRGDTHETAFREGERNVALMLISKVGMDLEKLKRRIEESEKEE